MYMTIKYIIVSNIKITERGEEMNSYKIIDKSIIMNKFITVKEFAEIYGIGINSAYSIARINGFPKIKVGNRIYIVKSKLDDWVINNIGNEF